MGKKFIVRIGYVDYAVEPEDATALLLIASRSKPVRQEGYRGPYYVQNDDSLFVDNLALADVEDAPADEKPDKFTEATRASIPF